MVKDVIIACDFPSLEDTLHFLDRFGDSRPYLKIGMELFYAEGPAVVRALKERGHRVFLDLKLHDIPNTVAGAMRALAGLGADMVNLHASGTIDMMRAALKGLTRPNGTRPLVIAVTLLTSISQQVMQDELLMDGTPGDVVLHLARNARLAGLDGVVCSPLEAELVHSQVASDFLTVTPGIRFSADGAGDQKRFTTPEQARRMGADYIVVGRPITAADNPLDAYRRCTDAFLG